MLAGDLIWAIIYYRDLKVFIYFICIYILCCIWSFQCSCMPLRLFTKSHITLHLYTSGTISEGQINNTLYSIKEIQLVIGRCASSQNRGKTNDRPRKMNDTRARTMSRTSNFIENIKRARMTMTRQKWRGFWWIMYSMESDDPMTFQHHDHIQNIYPGAVLPPFNYAYAQASDRKPLKNKSYCSLLLFFIYILSVPRVTWKSSTVLALFVSILVWRKHAMTEWWNVGRREGFHIYP